MFEQILNTLAFIYCIGCIIMCAFIPEVERQAKERMPYYVQVIFLLLWPVVVYGSYNEVKRKRKSGK